MDASGSNLNQEAEQHSTSPSLDKSSAEHPPWNILLVEDNKADVFVVREALQLAHVSATVEVIKDGDSAIQYVDSLDADQSKVSPDLVILDLNLPKKSGVEVLRKLRASKRSARALVIVVTSSDAVRDHEETSRLGANQYFRKPSRYDAYLKLGEIVKTLLSNEGATGTAT